MKNIIKIKGFSSHMTSEGKRISYSFSEIDQDGNIVRENVNASFVVVNLDLEAAIDTVNKFLLDRESAKE